MLTSVRAWSTRRERERRSTSSLPHLRLVELNGSDWSRHRLPEQLVSSRRPRPFLRSSLRLPARVAARRPIERDVRE